CALPPVEEPWCLLMPPPWSTMRLREPLERSPCLLQRIQQRALAFQALRALLGEALHTGEDRLRVEVRFGNDVRLQPAREPLIVPVRGEGIVVGEGAHVAQGPHASRTAAHEHDVLACPGG